jgi:hypothetical protein
MEHYFENHDAGSRRTRLELAIETRSSQIIQLLHLKLRLPEYLP